MEAVVAAGVDGATHPGVNWRRNLFWLWVVNALTQFGVYSAHPFIPLYIRRELGVHSDNEAAFWVGLAGSAIGLSMILTSTFWGRIADRFGRKNMTLRAAGVGGLFVASAALVQTPLQLVGVRFLTGSVAGTQSSITALVGSETPPSKVGWALGVIGSATAVGRAGGALLGGLLVVWVGLRYQFALAGLLMSAATIPLLFLVKETDRRRDVSRRASLRVLLARAPADNIRMAALLLVVQSIATVTNFTTNQFLGVKLIESAHGDPAFLTGLAFTAGAAATAIGALGYSRLVGRLGYCLVAAISAALFGVGTLAVGLSQDPIAIVAATGCSGVVFGACIPALNSMVGLESPEPLRATVYGAGNSMIGVGLVIVPLLTGMVAATIGVSVALVGVGVGAALSGIVLLIAGREPKTPGV
jgi:MFS transporter, DHA1 family, multidrug resistance protein